MPSSSPGSSIPVGRPNPKRRTQRSNLRAPSLRPIITEPTFEDWARMSATFSVTRPRSCASPITPVGHLDLGGRSNGVSG